MPALATSLHDIVWKDFLKSLASQQCVLLIGPDLLPEENLFRGLLRDRGAEPLVILYGKSGYGKRYLLFAGIFPRLQAECQRYFLKIHFGTHRPVETPPPVDTTRQALLNLS